MMLQWRNQNGETFIDGKTQSRQSGNCLPHWLMDWMWTTSKQITELCHSCKFMRDPGRPLAQNSSGPERRGHIH
jgi:hypothetical protein